MTDTINAGDFLSVKLDRNRNDTCLQFSLIRTQITDSQCFNGPNNQRRTLLLDNVGKCWISFNGNDFRNSCVLYFLMAILLPSVNGLKHAIKVRARLSLDSHIWSIKHWRINQSLFRIIPHIESPNANYRAEISCHSTTPASASSLSTGHTVSMGQPITTCLFWCCEDL